MYKENIGTKGDYYFRKIATKILNEGCWDKNPRPHWPDGTPAHTLSINGYMTQYDASKECPLITLRPIATKSSFGELLWIYQDQTNDLQILEDKYGVKWWDEWALRDRSHITPENPEGYVLNEQGHRHIGACYGETIRRHNQMNALIQGLKSDPDGRRHITNMWQVEDFKDPHGLKPCCYQTNWNVRHSKDGIDYLDMATYQRSSDFATAGCINQTQYFAFMIALANVLGYEPGIFTWFVENVQIYDRHIPLVEEMLNREEIDYPVEIRMERKITDWYDVRVKDFAIFNYDCKAIEDKNPQIKFPVAI